MASASPAAPRSEPGIPIAASIAWGVLVWPGLMIAVFTPMMFDAPGSASNPQVWLMAAFVLSFPLLCAIAIGGSWIAWRASRANPSRGAVVAQAIFACLPVLHVLVLVFGFLFWTFGTPTGLQMHEIKYQ